MANQEGAAKSDHYLVVSQAPDACKSPSTPVPYTIVAYLSDAVDTSKDVCIRGAPVFHMQSRVARVIGNEAGVGGGVASSVNKGYCRPLLASTTVRANAQFVCRHEHTTMEMNCSGPEGPANTVGKLIYLGAMVPAALGPDGGALDTSKDIAPASLLDTLGLTPEQIVGLTNKAVALTQLDWDNPAAVLGAIGGLASTVGFGELGRGLSNVGQGIGLASADWSDPATALSALGVAGGLAGLGGDAALAAGLGCALSKLSKLGLQGLALTRTDWSNPVSAVKGLMGAASLAGQFSGPRSDQPAPASKGASGPAVPHLAGPDGRPRLDQARAALEQLRPKSQPRKLTTEDLAFLREHNAPAADYYDGLAQEKRAGVLFEVEVDEGGAAKGNTARIYVPERGYSASAEEQAAAPRLPAALEAAFVSQGGAGTFYELTGLESPPSQPGSYLLFGGLIDLGSPTMPGAGTGLLWFVPDRILGADMSPYFDYHDLHYYGEEVTVADVRQIFDVEWGAFLAGLSASGAGPLTMALQVVYSAATSSVGMLTALWNSAQGLMGTIAGLPSELSLAGLSDLLGSAFDSLSAGVAGATSPSGVLGACFGAQAKPIDAVVSQPAPAAPAGTDGVLITVGVSDAAAQSVAATMAVDTSCSEGPSDTASSGQSATSSASGDGESVAGQESQNAGETTAESSSDSDAAPAQEQGPLADGEAKEGLENIERDVVKQAGSDKADARLQDLENNKGLLEHKVESERAYLADQQAKLDKLRADPNASKLHVDAATERTALAKKVLSKAENELWDANLRLDHAKGFGNASTAAGGLFALDDLVQAEKERDRLLAQGKVKEAYEHSLGAAAKYVVDSAMSVPNKLSGGTAIAAGMAASAAAQGFGEHVGHVTYDNAVHFSHWLYGQSWWPKNRKPRVE